MKFPVVLAVALVGIGFLLLKQYGSSQATPSRHESVNPSTLQSGPEQPVAARENNDTTTPKEVRPDTSTDYPKLRLQGIFHRQGDAFVIINSQTLAVGDKVEGVTVTKITRDSVSLRWEDHLKTLTLR
jgi:hypothetical protein